MPQRIKRITRNRFPSKTGQHLAPCFITQLLHCFWNEFTFHRSIQRQLTPHLPNFILQRFRIKGCARPQQFHSQSVKRTVDGIRSPRSALGISKQWADRKLVHPPSSDFKGGLRQVDDTGLPLSFCFGLWEHPSLVLDINMPRLNSQGFLGPTTTFPCGDLSAVGTSRCSTGFALRYPCCTAHLQQRFTERR